MAGALSSPARSMAATWQEATAEPETCKKWYCQEGTAYEGRDPANWGQVNINLGYVRFGAQS